MTTYVARARAVHRPRSAMKSTNTEVLIQRGLRGRRSRDRIGRGGHVGALERRRRHIRAETPSWLSALVFRRGGRGLSRDETPGGLPPGV